MRHTTFILFLFASCHCKAQTYSKIIPDSIINQFVSDVLNAKEPYGSVFNKLPKRVYYKPINIGTADWSSETDTSFDQKFQMLLTSKTDLSNDDIDFIRTQYYSINDSAWNFDSSAIKLKRHHGSRVFEYSLPLFSKDFKKAIFWRYWYGGPTHAYSELHLYVWEKGHWEIKKILAGYVA